MSTPDGPTEPRKKGSLTGAGVALVVVGLLILVPSGLCTGLMGIAGFVAAVSDRNWSDFVQMLTEAISFGLIPILIGSLLLWAGLRLRKKK
jgi:hypothetical protein